MDDALPCLRSRGYGEAVKEVIPATEVLWDDIDFSKGEKVKANHRNVNLSFDGDGVELDLSDERYKEIRDLIQPYLDLGRRVRPEKSQPTRKTRETPMDTLSRRMYLSDLRAWAEAVGKPIEKKQSSERGWTYHYPEGIEDEYREHIDRVNGLR